MWRPQSIVRDQAEVILNHVTLFYYFFRLVNVRMTYGCDAAYNCPTVCYTHEQRQGTARQLREVAF